MTALSSLRLPLLIAMGSIACGLIGTAAFPDEAARSIWDGVYTAAQAQRGATEYSAHCTECHMDTLSGDGAEVPPLSGKPFTNNWDGLDLTELYDRIHDTMPQSNPGTLSAQQVVDLMAYILSGNNIPAGTKELPVDTASLKAIHFDAKRPSH